MGEMLEENLTVLKAWFKELIGKTNLRDASGWPVEKYLDFINNALQESKYEGERTLQPSDLSVMAATFKSLASYDRHTPKTMEDVFSVIHQNQLYCLEILNQMILPPLNTLVLPSLLKKCIDEMKFRDIDRVRDFLPPALCGVHFTKENMEFHYNIGLRNHSTTLIFETNYDNPNELLLHIKFFGEARGRWSTMIMLIQLMDYLGMIKLQHLDPTTEQEMSFTWSISQDKQVPIVWRELETLLCYTMERCQDNYVNAFFGRTKEMSEKAGEFFFFHSEYIGKDYGNAIKCLNSFFQTDQGKCALADMSNNFGTSLDLKVRQKEIKILENYCNASLFINKLPPELVKVIQTILPRYVQNGDDLSEITFIFRNTKMYDLGYAYCQKFKDSLLLTDLRMVKNIYLDLLEKRLYIDDIESYASVLLQSDDKKILTLANELLINLVKNNRSFESAQICVKKMRSFEYLDYLQGWELKNLEKELEKKNLNNAKT
jgi:hypothetical protein